MVATRCGAGKGERVIGMDDCGFVSLLESKQTLESNDKNTRDESGEGE